MTELEDHYRNRVNGPLGRIAASIERQLKGYLDGEPRIDRVSVRVKSLDSFLRKAATMTDEKKPKYNEPLHQIQDQIGARVVTFYKSDIQRVSSILLKYFREVEVRHVVPDSDWKFGYFGTHFIFLIPSDSVPPKANKELVPDFFEVQIKTLFQHAWSEANHDLGYKTATNLEHEDFRRLSFTSAQAWGADEHFDELFQKRRRY